MSILDEHRVLVVGPSRIRSDVATDTRISDTFKCHSIKGEVTSDDQGVTIRLDSDAAKELAVVLEHGLAPLLAEGDILPRPSRGGEVLARG